MLSTTHTLSCPTCGQPATIRVLSGRQRRNAPHSVITPQIAFSCRRGCVLAAEELSELSGVDATG